MQHHDHTASGSNAEPRRGPGRRFGQQMTATQQHDIHGHHGRGAPPEDGPGFGFGRGPEGRFGPPDDRPGDRAGLSGHGGPRGRGPRGGGRRDGRAGRGDVRAAVLLLLADQPMHGYQLIQQIVERSGGVWTPSPGSVYPALQQLEDEGLLRFEPVDGRKTASLTEPGTAYVQANRAELGSPWDDVGGAISTEVRDLRPLAGSLLQAVRQVAQVGSREQAAQAATVLTAARTSLYRILAGDAPHT